MKRKSKKLISVLTSLAMTAACTGSIVYAEEPNTNWEADIYYIIVDELDENGKHCQWYTTNNIAFRANGVNVKLDGEDVTDESFFAFDKGITPPEVYNGKDFDYEVPIAITSRDEPLDAILPVKIGKEGDVNLDHKVDVRDSSAIVRDTEYFSENNKSKLDEFGRYLGAPENDSMVYGLTLTKASTVANKLAKDALDRASGTKYENKNNGTGDKDYSISISKANGLPGETVTLQVVVEADDSFESLDALIEWDDDTLKSAGAVSVNGTLCESYVEDGMVSIVDYSSGNIKDGAIASIDFIIPEDAKPGTNLDVYFSSVETFAVHKDGVVSEEAGNVVNVVGATIGVLEPKTTTPTVTTITTTTAETTTTTVTTTVDTTTTKAETTEVATTAASTVSEISTTEVVTVPVSATDTTAVSTTVTNITTETKATTFTKVTTATLTTKNTIMTGVLSTVPSMTTKVTTIPKVTTTITTTDDTTIIIPVEPGDANLDGKVDIRDAALIAYRLSIGEGSMLHNIADYNRDGKKDIRDAAAIAKFLSYKPILEVTK